MGNAQVWQLNEAQQALVTEYAYIAKVTATRRGSVSDRDGSLSACNLALCRAAHKWVEGFGNRTFKSYAIWACHQALKDEYKLHRFAIGRQSRNPKYIETNSGRLERPYSPEPPINALVEAERHERMVDGFCVLSPQELTVMELRLSGMENREIQAFLGLRRSHVYSTIRRASAKLKRFLSDETS